MSELLKNIDARTRLAGTNKLEILLFTLGVDHRTNRRESFGVNVFKVREVMRTPPITAAPEMQDSVEGMVSLRGQLVPVVDLGKYSGINTDGKREVMIVTEYNGHTQAFLVEAVDTILRLDWAQMRVPPEMLTAKMGGLVTAVTELNSEQLIMMLDVEKVLAETTHFDEDYLFKNINPIEIDDVTIYYADDSTVARKQIEKTLNTMGVRSVASVNGRVAWDELQRVAAHCEATGKRVRDVVTVILTDVEMPEMDGYILTKNIKADPRFEGVPIIMHSSLSGESNQTLGRAVGVDAYVSKFEPQKLAQVLTRFIEQAHVAATMTP